MRWPPLLWLAAPAALAATPAHADPLVNAITRHDDGDIAALRERLPDDSARCALGVAYIFRDDLTRAALYLEGCAEMWIAPGVAGWVRLAGKALDDRLQMSELAAIEVTTTPAGLAVEIDTVPGELFPTPSTIWLPAGAHALRAQMDADAGLGAGAATAVIAVKARTRAAARLAVEIRAPARQELRVAVMRANDCARMRRRYRTSACALWTSDDDLELPPTRPSRGVRPPDLIAAILQTAEEL